MHRRNGVASGDPGVAHKQRIATGPGRPKPEGSVHTVRCCRVSGLIDCGTSTAAGPYGDTRVGSKIVEVCSKARDPSLVSLPRLMTVCRYPRPTCSRVQRCRTGSCLLRRQGPVCGRSRSSSPAPRRCAPSGWPAARRPACAACAPASGRATGRSCRVAPPSLTVAIAPEINSRRRSRRPIFDILPSFGFPPVEL